MNAGCRSGLLLAQAKISLSVAKCEASEKWWPTWHLGKAKKKAESRSVFCLGKYAHSSSPLASFLDGDTCKLITSLYYIHKTIICEYAFTFVKEVNTTNM